MIANTALLMERLQSRIVYNPLSERMCENPLCRLCHPSLSHPVHRSHLLKAWLFTRYADVDAILRDHLNYSNDPRNAALSSRQRAMAADGGRIHNANSGPSGPHTAARVGDQGFYTKGHHELGIPYPQDIRVLCWTTSKDLPGLT